MEKKNELASGERKKAKRLIAAQGHFQLKSCKMFKCFHYLQTRLFLNLLTNGRWGGRIIFFLFKTVISLAAIRKNNIERTLIDKEAIQ